MTELEFGYENTNDRLAVVAERLSKQLGRHSFDGQFEKLQAAEMGRQNPLAEMEQALKEEIIGQPEAAEAIITALRREQIRNPKRPISNLMFLGPTGVGKSETGKEIARLIHGEEGGGLIKIDCSNYSSNHTVSALLGAPPSYVGREQKPVFDSPELDKSKCVVMFDEIEKGSQALWDLLLQIMDDGELTLNGTGKTVSFRNAIIILTSNVGSAEMAKLSDQNKLGFRPDTSVLPKKSAVVATAKKALGEKFRPEIIGRLDDTVVFNKLTDEQYGAILERHVEKANERYSELGVMLTLTPELRDELVASCDDRHILGARPVLRQYERIVESLLADYITTGGIPKGNRVYALLPDNNVGIAHTGTIELYYEEDSRLLPRKELLLPAAISQETEANTAQEAPTAQVLGEQAVNLAIATKDFISSKFKQRQPYGPLFPKP